MSKISRRQYSDLYGPTTGDKIRLADTDLYIEIEKDLRVYGEEAVYGGGKTLRDGMGYDNELTSAAGAPDLVITNVTILDAVQGVIKADLGIKNGLIVGIGKAGNPSTMSGVTRGLALGPGTDAISGEHLILTAGGIDAHVHFISPQQAQAALSNGVTTLFGGGIGPSDGTNGTTITPGTWNIEMMLRSFDAWPVNAGVHGKGNCSALLPIEEQIRAGAMGLKVHEDWGSTPAAIRMALTAADDHDVQVCIHTDTLNEAGFVESTIAAFEGRTIHTYHTEGAGGGHAPDIIRVAGISNVIPSSTNPTMPYGINSQAELFDMVMVCHNLSPKIPTDVAFAESRVRAETIAAENVLHDLGAISILSSDSQAMGRVGENWARTIQTAHLMKARLGAYPGDASGNDNQRVLRFVAKVTINPAIVAGVSHVIGSVEVGKMADLVLWEPAFFGAKPKMVIKGGMISWAIMGDPNASLPTPQPVVYRPMFGALGPAVAKTRVTFTSHAAYEDGIVDRYELTSKVVPVYGTRTITKASMVRNDRLPVIKVNPETFAVMVDGKHATIEPATHLPLAQLHFFS
ncbi:urease subunit alpha [Methylorubrum extorquens]|jgi:urease subunit alpha|uniref:Urease subunit alpha n=1 Tax=Methylorubrum extorquens (strain ATCC 14718 / DSM 1338 / JCM 2805 / NCIMB 9133 / AM1) TaxID=272630 RepID=C5AXC3_METEA|nr:urease subunit alpha [Methylorubrum extorquens]MDF9861388.1 urease subunit alpha [Methylorubrum pseudosasae]MDH6635013.1 urease subunit alpha [Methylobacterium sp. SuP10 SLI 274]ACS38962.1 urease alpha subunit [Methylorubrum extorquens AM1]MCP1542952.1 urease subunit alpha [Methylorubrum extorquens]MCP1561188.1 urease subunit alpha [Methylorubrum extorquens]